MKDDELIVENARLNKLIKDAADHWLALQRKHLIPWEGAIDGAMQAACRHIEALTAEVERKDAALQEITKSADAIVQHHADRDMSETEHLVIKVFASIRDLAGRAALQPQEKVG